MQFELRSVTFSAALSEETNAYTAMLWVDGRQLAHVSNRGHGGCDEVHPVRGRTHDEIAAVEAWIKANLPAQTTNIIGSDGKPFVMEQTLETVCGDLLAKHLIEKDVRRLVKRTVAYVDPATRKVMSFKGKNDGVRADHLIADVLRRKPDAVILNRLPFEQAVEAYRAAMS